MRGTVRHRRAHRRAKKFGVKERAVPCCAPRLARGRLQLLVCIATCGVYVAVTINHIYNTWRGNIGFMKGIIGCRHRLEAPRHFKKPGIGAKERKAACSAAPAYVARGVK